MFPVPAYCTSIDLQSDPQRDRRTARVPVAATLYDLEEPDDDARARGEEQRHNHLAP